MSLSRQTNKSLEGVIFHKIKKTGETWLVNIRVGGMTFTRLLKCRKYTVIQWYKPTICSNIKTHTNLSPDSIGIIIIDTVLQ